MKAPHSIKIGTEGAPAVVFAHGWGRSHRDFIPVAEALAPVAQCYLLDLPGFGDSPRPDAGWGTQDYAQYLQTHLREDLGLDHYIWVGHSFGGRIGLRLAAAQAPLDHLVIVAGAGVPREVARSEQIKRRFRGRLFKLRKRLARGEDALAALEARFGSADYVHSREIGMRDIFLSTISEDQSADLPGISVPTTLIYGARDTETPPEIGRKIADLVPGSTYVECPEFDHISILDRGRHQIALAVKTALQEVAD